jgi:hypothetical protein
LARACVRAGFDLVAPVSWGEELLATRVAEVIEARRPGAAVVANCPFVAETMRATPTRTRTIASVSPPIATARYLRAAFPHRPVHVTYIGACPGATPPDVDHRLSPEFFLAGLIEAGIDVNIQPCHLDGQLPADRSRHASLPGGMPEARWLDQRVGARSLEATPATVDAVATLHSSSTVVIDLGAACGCACSQARPAAEHLDTARSTAPVVLPLRLELADHRLMPVRRLIEVDGAIEAARLGVSIADRTWDHRAAFVERGLSSTNALRPPEPLTRQFGAVPEPWSSVNPINSRPTEPVIPPDAATLPERPSGNPPPDWPPPAVEPAPRSR